MSFQALAGMLVGSESIRIELSRGKTEGSYQVIVSPKLAPAEDGLDDDEKQMRVYLARPFVLTGTLAEMDAALDAQLYQLSVDRAELVNIASALDESACTVAAAKKIGTKAAAPAPKASAKKTLPSKAVKAKPAPPPAEPESPTAADARAPAEAAPQQQEAGGAPTPAAHGAPITGANLFDDE
jgi:PRTRC genetic system protein E